MECLGQLDTWAWRLPRPDRALSPEGQKPQPAKDVTRPGGWDGTVEWALNQESGHGFHRGSLGQWLPLCGILFPHLRNLIFVFHPLKVPLLLTSQYNQETSLLLPEPQFPPL